MTSRRAWLGILVIVLLGVSAFWWHLRQQARIEEDWGIPVTVPTTFADLQTLELPRTVDRLDWLDTIRLKQLEVSDSAINDRLDGLPDTLEVLFARNLRIAEAAFPAHLAELDIRNSDLETIKGLPESLETLAIGGSRPVKSVQLSPHLTTLVLEDFDPSEIKAFPGSLTNLTIIGSRASTWRGPFPSSLESLTIRAPRLEHLPELPARLVSLVLVANPRVRSSLPPYLAAFETEGASLGRLDALLSLKELQISGYGLPDKIPATLQHLRFIFQGVASPGELILPDLPNLLTLALINYRGTVTGMPRNLTELDVSGSPQIPLRNLPQTLRKLVVGRRASVDLSKLPQNLEFLDVSYVERLDSAQDENLLPKLVALVYQGSPGALPRLREGLKVLDVSNSPSLRELPQTLPSTLTELYIRGTGIASVSLDQHAKLEILDVCNSRIEGMGGLPASLVGLRAHVNQLDGQIKFPDSLRHLAIRTKRDCAADEGLWSREMERRRQERGGV